MEALIREGLIDISLVKLFMVPAMFYHVKTCMDNDIDVRLDDIFGPKGIKQSIIENFFAACDEFNTTNEPLILFSEALRAYQSRKKIEKALASVDCDMEVRPGSTNLKSYGYYISKKNCASVTDNVANNYRPLFDVDGLMHKRNLAIADAFAVVDKAVIINALSGICESELDFMALSRIDMCRTAFKPIVAPQFLTENTDYEYTYLAIKKNIDTLTAEFNGTTRAYALIKEKEEYRIERLGSRFSEYMKFLENDTRDLINDKNIRPVFYKIGEKRLKTANDSLETLAGSISQLHRVQLLNKLNALVAGNSTMAAAENIFIDSIPFFGCDDSSHSVDETDGSTACNLDLEALAPVVGMRLTINTHASTEAGNTPGNATAEEMSGFVARRALRMAMKDDLHLFAKFTRLPPAEPYNRMSLSKLATEYLRVFDPSLGIIGQVDGVIMEEVIKAGEIVSRHIPALSTILALMRSKEIAAPKDTSETPHIMAWSPVHNMDIPVVKLNGDTFHKKDVYARVNPENNDLFSQKHTLSHNGTLIPIPAHKGKGLLNIRPQGLGRGWGKNRHQGMVFNAYPRLPPLP
ncbi:hypothetical protein ABK905_05080 [Acerihabitans sp. KWT182]|uniref:Uncharacterized protein n=1 Tax=Acerihabitans sp. KWT182 TaxID=3157919 RepID=A0AAU7QBE7_9GAMM